MDILQEATGEGIQFEVRGDWLRLISTRPIPPDLLEKLKANNARIIEALKHQTEPYEYQSNGQAEKIDSRPSRESVSKDYRYCESYSPPRDVHLEVCQRHIEQADLRCMCCGHLSAQDIDTWGDAYLNKAIAALNRLDQKGNKISCRKRDQVDQLERQITKAFLAHDMPKVKDLVDKWENLFREMRTKSHEK